MKDLRFVSYHNTKDADQYEDLLPKKTTILSGKSRSRAQSMNETLVKGSKRKGAVLILRRTLPRRRKEPNKTIRATSREESSIKECELFG